MGANTLEGSSDPFWDRSEAVAAAAELMPREEEDDHMAQWDAGFEHIPKATNEQLPRTGPDRGHPVPGRGYTFEELGDVAIPAVRGGWESGMVVEAGANSGMPRHARYIPHVLERIFRLSHPGTGLPPW